MYYIPQVTKSGCGFACLKMLLAIAHKDERYLYLKEDENRGHYSYQDLVNIAQRYEVTLEGAKFPDKDDLRNVKKFPLILTVIKENDVPHAVLATKIRGKRILIQDPEKGVSWQKIDKFVEIWDGTLLSITGVQGRPFTSRIIDVHDTKGDIISYITQALAASFIAVATFFVKPGGSLLIPLIFCALSLISEILLRFFLLKRMQRCDKYLRMLLPYVQRRDYFEFYKRSQEYKRSSLTMGLNFVFYLLVVILIATISLINSLTFAISIGIAFLVAFIDVFFICPIKRDINRSLEEQEQELRRVKEEDEMELKVKSMEVKSYRYAYLEFASKVMAIVFFIISSFFVSAVEHTFALTNIVFYTCVSFLLYQYIVPLLSYDYKVSENTINKVRINNLIHQDENNGKKYL